MSRDVCPISDVYAEDTEERILCSICIATYLRPALLEELLLSLQAQLLPPHVSIEVIIVDNDPNQTARPVASRFQRASEMDVRYFVQPEKNISLTRNMSVQQANGQYLLFIDDDEVASEPWLYHLLKTAQTYHADGVFGEMMPRFHEATPEWMRRRTFYYGPMATTGKEAQHIYGGNCLVKAALLKEMDTPFDPRYGITGGEDTHLFETLQRRGCRFVSCREAVAYEYIPPSRTSVSYLFRRSMKGGSAHTRRRIEFAQKVGLAPRLFMLVKAIGYGTVSAVMTIVVYPSKVRRLHWLMRVGSNLGRLLAVFDWHYKGYK